MRNRERDKKILQARNRGVPADDIANNHGISRARVYQITSDKCTYRRQTQMDRLRTQRANIAEARMRGESTASLGSRFEVSESLMFAFLSEIGLSAAHIRPTFFGQVGDKFNGWTIKNNQRCGTGRRSVLCACECGKVKQVEIRYLKEGLSKRCRSCSASLWHKAKKETTNGSH
jgi:hypothetical protein